MKYYSFFLVAILFTGCMETPERKVNNEKSENIQSESDNVKDEDIASIEERLKKEGYQTFSYKEGDTTYLMQQYYMVFLKTGPVRTQDSTEAAELQKQHLAHLSRLHEKVILV